MGKTTRTPRPARRRYKRRRYNITGKAKMKWPIRTKSLTVKRTWYAGLIQPSNVAVVNFWNYVQCSLNSAGSMCGTVLTGLPNVNEYIQLFDTFKIKAIKLRFEPRAIDMTLNQSNTGIQQERSYVSIIKDPRSMQDPIGPNNQTQYNLFNEQGNAKRYRADKPFSVYWKPLIIEQFGGGASRFVKPKTALLDLPGLAMQHRGFHMYFHNQSFGSTFLTSFNVYATYYMTFNGQR